ncbi:hypothetical protein B7463_g5393, partial [Scytalidium lignicola]
MAAENTVSFTVFRGSTSGNIVESTTTRELQHNEIYIETTHSGLCGTDIHGLTAGFALGHEGIGFVRQIGPGVTSVTVGARVGYGFYRKVCGHCDCCLTGWEQFCENRKQYTWHDHDIGTFGTGVVWDADAVFPIPDGLDSAEAAPLICAGGTIWTILTQYGIKGSDRVGIIGIGGLGHLAIKLAAAFGCHVVALSGDASKEAEALQYGAKEFHVYRTTDPKPDNFKALNHILLCGSGNVDYLPLTELMAVHGTIYPITVTTDSVPIPLAPMLYKAIRIQTTFINSRHVMRSLLDFVVERNIKAEIQTFPMTAEGLEEAVKILKEGKMRYRGVLVRDGIN